MTQEITEEDARQALVDKSRLCIDRGLSNATAGNLSIRFGAGMLITPSGIEPASMTADQISYCTFDGQASGGWKPSSEWALHAMIYQARPEAGGIVHAHPTYCVAVSVLREPIPAFHYMVAGFGGTTVPCAPYVLFGTRDLAVAVADTLGQRYSACLMANHGMIALGRDLDAAFRATERLETLAHQYQLARSMGPVALLTDDEMAEVHGAYKSYGYGKPATTGQAQG
ncbi:class II aldolase/adducin family protein [Chachezhania sediminis]|uniref:class II aldolase/adducin family protein n=1 Tax=Chachezhania sediminis TaxID=2599291 RepID=UPI00131C2447|nr:class II aldolase/adducin family protein [Chachezhania sediminis]